MNSERIAVIGGSGIYDLFNNHGNTIERQIETPFGRVKVFESYIGEKLVFFLPRHGSSHSIAPHMINYKANIFALFKLGVKYIIATNAVGSLKNEIKPGEFVILDQFIDIMSGPHTFFDGSFEIEINNELLAGVKHTDVTEPYSKTIRESIFKSFEKVPEEIFYKNGCYVMFNGPRFETKAEIKMFQEFGDVVGMTGAAEVALARELNLDYASICLVTNYGAGIQENVNHHEVLDLFNSKLEFFRKIILDIIRRLV